MTFTRAVDQIGTGPSSLLFRRLTTPQPNGQVIVRIEVWQYGRRVGTIRQERGGWWRFRQAAAAGGVGVGTATTAAAARLAPEWERGWRTAAECREAVAARLLPQEEYTR